jgi:hypothetical protein
MNSTRLSNWQQIIDRLTKKIVEKECNDLSRFHLLNVSEFADGFDQDSDAAGKFQTFPQCAHVLLSGARTSHRQFQRTLQPSERLVESMKKVCQRTAPSRERPVRKLGSELSTSALHSRTSDA